MELDLSNSALLAWVVLAFSVAALWVAQLQSSRKSQRIQDRLDRISKSVGHMDDWANDVDARLAALEASRDAVSNNPSARPFLESMTAKSSSRDSMEERVYTILANLRQRRMKQIKEDE